jgi:hypothetical protein
MAKAPHRYVDFASSMPPSNALSSRLSGPAFLVLAPSLSANPNLASTHVKEQSREGDPPNVCNRKYSALQQRQVVFAPWGRIEQDLGGYARDLEKSS